MSNKRARKDDDAAQEEPRVVFSSNEGLTERQFQELVLRRSKRFKNIEMYDSSMGVYTPPPGKIGVPGDESYFDDFPAHFAECCKNATAIVGCIAWINDDNILEMLASRFKNNVQLVLNKEREFLKNEMNYARRFPMLSFLGKMGKLDMTRLRMEKNSTWSPLALPPSSCANGTEDKKAAIDSMQVEALRCMGVVAPMNMQNQHCRSLMHDKFVVFLKEDSSAQPPLLKPYAFWTGSYNFTNNSTYSLENASYREEPVRAMRYLQEWYHILLLSEKIAQSKPCITPEYVAINF